MQQRDAHEVIIQAPAAPGEPIVITTSSPGRSTNHNNSHQIVVDNVLYNDPPAPGLHSSSNTSSLMPPGPPAVASMQQQASASTHHVIAASGLQASWTTPAAQSQPSNSTANSSRQHALLHVAAEHAAGRGTPGAVMAGTGASAVTPLQPSGQPHEGSVPPWQKQQGLCDSGIWGDHLQPQQAPDLKTRQRSSLRRLPSSAKHVCACIPNMLLLPLIALVVMALIVGAMVPVYYSFHKHGGSDTPFVYPPVEGDWQQLYDLDCVLLEGKMSDLQPDNFLLTLIFVTGSGGQYADDSDDGVLDVPDGYMLAVVLGSQSYTITDGSMLSQQSLDFTMKEDVKLLDYPFDKYHVSFMARALLVRDISQTGATQLNRTIGSGDVLPIPLYFVMYTDRQGYDITTGYTPVTDAPNGSSYQYAVNVDIRIERSVSTKFFSLFIVILNWCITLAMVVLTLDYLCIHKREVGYEAPSLAVALLFALPFVRDVQPDIPDIGCTVDVLGFFWNMVLVAACTVVLLSAIMAQQHAIWKAKQKQKKKKMQRVASSDSEGTGAQHAPLGAA